MNILYIYIIYSVTYLNLPDIAQLANEETRFKSKCAPTFLP